MLNSRRRYEGVRHAQPPFAPDPPGALGDRPVDGDLPERSKDPSSKVRPSATSEQFGSGDDGVVQAVTPRP